MTAKLDPRSARKHLQAFQFTDLFIEDLGWNHPERAKPMLIEHGGVSYHAQEISQLSGFRVFEIVTADPDAIFPDAKTQQAVWKRIAPHAVENILIFLDATRSRSVWLWMKRDGSKTHTRRHHYLKGQPGDLFLSKLASLVVDLSELDENGNIPITETARRVRQGLDIEIVTKAFFRDFQAEHEKLLDAIEGIPDPRERRWYASVLLNRLMFIWFLQQKGFLDVARAKDGNKSYLPEKLAASQKSRKNRFFRHFLRDLFFEGFAKPEGKREPIFPDVPLGDIPYLNGGLFLPHGIEARIEGDALFSKPYAKIKVPDAVFEDLFALFGRYSWSLNDTPGGDDREINPDVLGYIFEKYINQKEFGAYYTRPEITDYLCEQTIHQLVLDRINAGYESRKKLHETQPKSFLAPHRYDSIEDLLLHANGPVCQTVLQDILPRLSLLDPACGSGAFLVAALKTLLNLYTALIGRCEALAHAPVLQWIESERKQHKAPAAYWLKKKIVTENLYGVDLMEEATEIAKLRLFLSLVASAEKRDQLEPLPNIEFNLLAGNSLIGLLHVDSAKFDGRTGVPPVSSKKRLQQSRITLAYEEALGFTTETTHAPTTRESQQAHVATKQASEYARLLDEKNKSIELYKKHGFATGEVEGLEQDERLLNLRNHIEDVRRRGYERLNEILLEEFQALGIQYEQATWIPTSPAQNSAHSFAAKGQKTKAQGNALASASTSSAPTGQPIPAQANALASDSTSSAPTGQPIPAQGNASASASTSSAPTGQPISAQGNALGSSTPPIPALKGRPNTGGKEGKPEKRPLKIEDIQALQPFHWAYEFDEIIVNRGGFDAIITNPPWDIFKPNSKEFFEKFSDTITRNVMRIEDFEEEKSQIIGSDPEIQTAWLGYLSSFPHVSEFFRASSQYTNQIGTVNGRKVGSDINLFKLFTEQCTHLLAKGARCGIVIPSGIYTDLGAVQLRKMLFQTCRITGLFGFENRKVIFEGVHRSFKFVVLTFETGSTTHDFPVAFMRQDVRDLAEFPSSTGLRISPSLIGKLSPGSLSIMEFETSSDIAVAEKLLRHPLAGSEEPGTWNLNFGAEFHMTNDSKVFEKTPGPELIPLFEGKMIHQFSHAHATPRYWIEKAAGRDAILGRTEDKGQPLGYQRHRLGFRDIARNTDTRTLIAGFVPKAFCGNTLPLVTAPTEYPTNLFIACCFNSFTLDWLIRQKVTTHCSFFYIYQLPIPRLTAAHPDFLPLAERAARLVGTAPEFDDLLKEIFGKSASHKTHGVTDPQARLTLRAQIDALVARLYDLTQEEFQHILTTFPLVDESVKSQTLNTYRDLLKLGKLPDPRQ